MMPKMRLLDAALLAPSVSFGRRRADVVDALRRMIGVDQHQVGIVRMG
jgi:hypothetical protein